MKFHGECLNKTVRTICGRLYDVRHDKMQIDFSTRYGLFQELIKYGIQPKMILSIKNTFPGLKVEYICDVNGVPKYNGIHSCYLSIDVNGYSAKDQASSTVNYIL